MKIDMIKKLGLALLIAGSREVSGAALLAGLGALSCDGARNAVDPGRPLLWEVEPGTGDLEVTVTTTGADLDPDGYTVTVQSDERSQHIGINETVTFTGLSPGNHTVTLSHVADNCKVEGQNPRTVSVTAGQTASTTFQVICEPTAPSRGTLSITTVTTGEDQPAGYTLDITGPSAPDGTTVSIGANANFRQTVDAGTYTVQLNGVPSNCTLSTAAGPNPRDVSVPAGGTGSTTFSVTCTAVAPGTGTLSITTSTTGEEQPTDYTLTITGPTVPDGTTVSIGANETFTATVEAGTYNIELSGVPSNCTLSTAEGPNPRDVTVPAGGTGSTTFSVSCTAVGTTGTLSITTVTTGEGQPASYTLTATGPSFSTYTTVASGNAPSTWQPVRFYLGSTYAGQQIKLRVRSAYNWIAVDDIGKYVAPFFLEPDRFNRREIVAKIGELVPIDPVILEQVPAGAAHDPRQE